MAKSKDQLLKEAQAAGLVADDVSAENVTSDQLNALLRGDKAAWEGSRSSAEEIVAPDGHVVLSKEDIDARQ